MDRTTDPVMCETINTLEEAKKKLEQRSGAYGAYEVDDYMVKLPGVNPMVGYLQMLHLKCLRAISSVMNGEEFEAEDSLLDLVNYAAFAKARVHLEGVQKKSKMVENLGG